MTVAERNGAAAAVEFAEARVVPVGKLVEAVWNANRVSASMMAKLRRSVERFGFVEHLVVRPLGRGRFEVLSGNHRLRLLLELGVREVPVRVVKLGDADARVLAQALNRTRGEDDPVAYARLLESVLLEYQPSEVAEVLPVSVGALERVLLSMSAPAGDPDDVPDVPVVPRSKPGEVYELGPHRLLCGDALDATAHDLMMVDGDVDALLTDPPYGIDLDTDYSKIKGSAKSTIKGRVVAVNYPKIIGDKEQFDASFLAERYAYVREQFWFGANYYRRTLSPNDLDGSWFVWDKRVEGIDSVIGSCFELIWSRQPHKQDMLRYLWSGFTARNREFVRAHPTEKPVALLAELLVRHTEKGAVVLDPFAGSGTTLIAAEQTGRVCYAIEIDPGYCDVIRARYERFLGGGS